MQSFGKQRVICNADKGGQTIVPSEAKKLVVRTALKSAQHVLLALRGLPSQTSREQDLCCVAAWCEIGEETAKAGGRGKRTLLKNQHNQVEDQDKDDEPPEEDEREDAAQLQLLQWIRAHPTAYLFEASRACCGVADGQLTPSRGGA